MGCYASRSSPPFHFTTTITVTATTTTVNHQNPPSNSSNSSPSPHHFYSPFSDHYYNSSLTQTPVSRTMYMPTPLIHHPPLCKGDSNHFVSLTSTTYGSLIILDTTTANTTNTTTDNRKTIEECPVSSPDSVINTWELMEGLDEEFDTIKVENNSYNGEIIKPLWQHLSEESMSSKSDSNLVSKLVPHPVTEIQDSKGESRGFPVFDHGFVCDHCGDVRFVPCPNCNGSRKVFEEDEGRSIRCAYCNENGLISTIGAIGI
ncbi:hypothetical protein L1987_21476 [Smallanthus sonchifolius]|uniref:Uncharacterized protein n=1 Tax=Smallanthus sonchifolius TaxID=185202 RepID=A0ACB9IUG4_9ASTR|nr:hypothetical protein L1987_21476 [Smallanthus sonchifolius]